MESKFETWAIVELFGHNKIAGLCSEQNIAGSNMLRVDVPETSRTPGFTRFLSAASIYAINPCDEAVSRYFAEQLQVKPIEIWDINKFLRKQLPEGEE